MAWDASLVRSFDKSGVRGIFPYIFAGVNEFFQYHPQPFHATMDGVRTRTFQNPMVFTVANLTQFGGGAKIAPQAQPDDGQLELVVALRQDVPKLVGNIGRLFNGSLNSIPEVISERFKEMKVERERPSPVQLDGDLAEAGTDIEIRVQPKALNVLVPE
jgi:diacylglycerol kinase family enzyme